MQLYGYCRVYVCAFSLLLQFLLPLLPIFPYLEKQPISGLGITFKLNAKTLAVTTNRQVQQEHDMEPARHNIKPHNNILILHYIHTLPYMLILYGTISAHSFNDSFIHNNDAIRNTHCFSLIMSYINSCCSKLLLDSSDFISH